MTKLSKARRMAFYTAGEAALAWLLALLVQTLSDGGTLLDVNPLVWVICVLMLIRTFFNDVKSRLQDIEAEEVKP
jgi:Na+/melibiose symporter-like transporter